MLPGGGRPGPGGAALRDPRLDEGKFGRAEDFGLLLGEADERLEVVDVGEPGDTESCKGVLGSYAARGTLVSGRIDDRRAPFPYQ